MGETFILVIGYNATFKFSLDKQLKIVYFLTTGHFFFCHGYSPIFSMI